MEIRMIIIFIMMISIKTAQSESAKPSLMPKIPHHETVWRTLIFIQKQWITEKITGSILIIWFHGINRCAASTVNRLNKIHRLIILLWVPIVHLLTQKSQNTMGTMNLQSNVYYRVGEDKTDEKRTRFYMEVGWYKLDYWSQA